jgi:hypothetical protein
LSPYLKISGGRQLPLIVIPACRHADGTISSPGVPDVWRMASEDSEEFVSGFPPVHRLPDLNDLRKSSVGLVVTCRDTFDARSELLEVEPLCGPKRVLPKVRDDPLQQILPATNDVAVKVFSVVVGPPIDVNLPHPEELAQIVKTVDAARALGHHEVMRDLVSSPVTASTRAAWLPHEAD